MELIAISMKNNIKLTQIPKEKKTSDRKFKKNKKAPKIKKQVLNYIKKYERINYAIW